MRFKNPGGDLAWLTPLWAAGGLILAYVNIRDGRPVIAILYGALARFSSLVWLDRPWVAIPLTVYFALAIVGGAGRCSPAVSPP